jgi:hypothetical protein
MKRKVKKGVKMLTSLLEGNIVVDHKEIMNTTCSPLSSKNNKSSIFSKKGILAKDNSSQLPLNLDANSSSSHLKP